MLSRGGAEESKVRSRFIAVERAYLSISLGDNRETLDLEVIDPLIDGKKDFYTWLPTDLNGFSS